MQKNASTISIMTHSAPSETKCKEAFPCTNFHPYSSINKIAFALHLQFREILNIIIVQEHGEGSANMAKDNMTLRMEPELKEQAAALFKALGLDLSTATGLFYRQAIRCQGLPFEVKLNEPNEGTYAAMEAAEKGEDMFGPFDNVADLMEALNA